jgi:MFS family permease
MRERRSGPDDAPGLHGDLQNGRFARLRSLDRNVTALGIVSLVADLSSEMVYPLIPLFVTSVLGAPVAVLGLIEGVAEATASLTRYPFGRASDSLHRRRTFVFSGYGLSALGKLILALAYVWPVALAGRFVDRVGKGVRTAPRDALLAAGVPEKDRGLAFGLHRTLDTLGAVFGPLAALLLIDLGLSIRAVLAVAVLPGVASVVVIALFVRERAPAGPARARLRLRLPASPAFRWMLAGSLVFAAGNSSNTFILLRAKSLGYGVTAVILLYVLYNVTYAAGSLPLGGLSDHVGQFPVVSGGFLVFAAVYLGFALAHGGWALTVLFAVYGLYIAAPEGATKALLSRTTPDTERASALGLYDTAVGVAGFAASLLGGILWSAIGPWATFTYGATCALAGAAILFAGRGAELTGRGS